MPATTSKWGARENRIMTKKTVEFDAHHTVKQPAKVAFTTKDGDRVRFVAEKPTKVPVHVKFKANTKGK
jgi:hypothetical protein